MPETPILTRLSHKHRDVRFMLEHCEVFSNDAIARILTPKYTDAYAANVLNARRRANVLDARHRRRHAC